MLNCCQISIVLKPVRNETSGEKGIVRANVSEQHRVHALAHGDTSKCSGSEVAVNNNSPQLHTANECAHRMLRCNLSSLVSEHSLSLGTETGFVQPHIACLPNTRVWATVKVVIVLVSLKCQKAVTINLLTHSHATHTHTQTKKHTDATIMSIRTSWPTNKYFIASYFLNVSLPTSAVNEAGAQRELVSTTLNLSRSTTFVKRVIWKTKMLANQTHSNSGVANSGPGRPVCVCRFSPITLG